MTTLTADKRTEKKGRDPLVLFVKGCTKAFLFGALAVSYFHTVTVFTMLGLTDWQKYLTPLPFEGLMMLGYLGMGPRFAKTTRDAGKRLFLSMLVFVFVANIAAGLESQGGMLWGASLIVGLVIVKWYGPKLLPAPAPELSPQQKAAITKAKNKAEREALEMAKAKQRANRRRPATPKTATPATVAREVVKSTDLDADLRKLLG
jgi:hypothetical protein